MERRSAGVALPRVDPRVADAVVAVVIAVFAVVQSWPAYFPVPEAWLRVNWIPYLAPPVLAVVSTLPLAFRRRYPVVLARLSALTDDALRDLLSTSRRLTLQKARRGRPV